MQSIRKENFFTKEEIQVLNKHTQVLSLISKGEIPV